MRIGSSCLLRAGGGQNPSSQRENPICLAPFTGLNGRPTGPTAGTFYRHKFNETKMMDKTGGRSRDA